MSRKKGLYSRGIGLRKGHQEDRRFRRTRKSQGTKQEDWNGAKTGLGRNIDRKMLGR